MGGQWELRLYRIGYLGGVVGGVSRDGITYGETLERVVMLRSLLVSIFVIG